MIPVDQTVFEDSRGNCFAACVASILEIPISSVPNFTEFEDMHGAASAWLRERGLSFLSFCFPNQDAVDATFFEGPEFCIYSGQSPRRKADGSVKWHGVVGRTNCWGVRIVHDPHVSRAGLDPDGARWVRFIVPATPKKPETLPTPEAACRKKIPATN